ncbi:MAG: hypothetical protein N3E40_01640, partial [Dehalococcoidia bacterium]|nr:hypothetical protein [Dehalococcoidia bacterium]
VLGQCFRKTYFDETLGRVVSRLVLPSDCFVNSKATSLRDARRITHRFLAHSNDAFERQRAGLWLDVDLGSPVGYGPDPDAPHEFLEQHCYLDLDGDGYKEPYVVTVHLASSKVLRVVARWHPDGVVYNDAGKLVRIEPIQFFTHFGFLPNPDGSINYLGFGQLLEPINATINTCINQLIDCGTLYNVGGGFIGRGLKLRGGTFRFQPGEWKLVDVVGSALKDNIVPLPAREPSAVLFQLLGFLVQAARDISSVQEILSGDLKFGPNMPVGTALALVEQGLKVYTAIYRRIYRSLTDEFRKIYRLNSIHLDPFFTFYLAGEEHQVGAADYVQGDLVVVPNADPTLSSDVQRLLKAQTLASFSGRPGLNELEITRQLVRSISPEVADRVLLTDGQMSGKGPLPWQAPTPPQAILAQAKAALAHARAQESSVRIQMDLVRHRFELELLLAEIAKKKSDAALSLARAAEASSEVEADQLYKDLARLEAQVLDQIRAVSDAILGGTPTPAGGGQPGGVAGLEETPGLEEGTPVNFGDAELPY